MPDTHRVLHGGSFRDRLVFTRCTYRNFIGPINRFDYYGFRVVANGVKEKLHVLRGSAFDLGCEYARCTFRGSLVPCLRQHFSGFRVVVNGVRGK